MRKLALALLIGSLAACATKPLPYGNFVQDAPATFNDKLAADALSQLVATFPPASTRLNLEHPTPDLFGASLVEALRAKGYAVMEFQPKPSAMLASEANVNESTFASSATAKPAPAKKEAGLSFHYVIDGPFDGALYRITLTVGSKALTRAYIVDSNNVTPAGAWARKE